MKFVAVQRKWDHPRTCGEQGSFPATKPSITGSSPHMRGTDGGDEKKHPPPRIIPAHAGNSPPHLLTKPSETDHPRTCGEQEPPCVHKRLPLGSSPHMRGTAPCNRHKDSAFRIIPAHAGNSIAVGFGKINARDHPRTCGEQRAGMLLLAASAGSSPHMRGTATRFRSSVGAGRIIPAHAGNSGVYFERNSILQDHPRTCGEQV